MMLFVVIGLMFGGMVVGVWMMIVQKQFFDVIEKCNVESFWQVIFMMIVVFVVMGVVFVFMQWLKQWFEFQWCIKLIQDLIECWFVWNVFYCIECRQQVDNVDQCIVDDVCLFIEGFFDFGLQMMSQIGLIFIFGFMFWNLVFFLEVGFYCVYGYLFWMVILYGFFQVGIVYFVGCKFSMLNFEWQCWEVDFWFVLVQQCDLVEQIVFYCGQEFEKVWLGWFFEFIGLNWVVLILNNKWVMFMIQMMMMVMMFIFIWVMVLWFFVGQVLLGMVMQYQVIFLIVVYGIIFFVNNYFCLVEWLLQVW